MIFFKKGDFMSLLKGKKILITSGGTLEKWDNVRGHTNLAKGTIGCYLVYTAILQNFLKKCV